MHFITTPAKLATRIDAPLIPMLGHDLLSPNRQKNIHPYAYIARSGSDACKALEARFGLVEEYVDDARRSSTLALVERRLSWAAVDLGTIQTYVAATYAGPSPTFEVDVFIPRTPRGRFEAIAEVAVHASACDGLMQDYDRWANGAGGSILTDAIRRHAAKSPYKDDLCALVTSKGARAAMIANA